MWSDILWQGFSSRTSFLAPLPETRNENLLSADFIEYSPEMENDSAPYLMQALSDALEELLVIDI